jgi:hypothetical protein
LEAELSSDREQRIRNRAYALWEQDGRRHGRHDDHWAQATRDIDAGAESGDRTTSARKASTPSKPKTEKQVTAKPSAGKAAPASAKAATTKSSSKSAERAKRKGS